MSSESHATDSTGGDAASASGTERTDLLFQLIEKRFHLAAALCQLAEAQYSAAAQDDIDVTLGFLTRKQAILGDLSVIQQQLQPYMNDDPDSRQWRCADLRSRCQQLSGEGSRFLKEAAQLEENTLQKFTTKREAIAAQLQDGRDSILASSAYTAGEVLDGGQLDISDL